MFRHCNQKKKKFKIMENYSKGDVNEISEPSPFCERSNLVTMKVNNGSKIRNLMSYALARLKDEQVHDICWHGCGEAISKTITCAEMMKRRQKKLHQITKLRFKKREEHWEPKLDGLERLRVNKNIPEIFILLSKDILDSSEPGYQAPGNLEPFWNEVVTKQKYKNSTGQQGRREYRDVGQNLSRASFRTSGKKKSKQFKIDPKSGENAVTRAQNIGGETNKLQSDLKTTQEHS